MNRFNQYQLVSNAAFKMQKSFTLEQWNALTVEAQRDTLTRLAIEEEVRDGLLRLTSSYDGMITQLNSFAGLDSYCDRCDKHDKSIVLDVHTGDELCSSCKGEES